MKLDKDTQKILSDGEKMEEFVKGEGWALAKKKLYDRLITLDSISSVPKKGFTPERRLKEFEIREGVVSVILDWISDIEGTAQSAKHNREAMREVREDSIVQFFG